MFVNSTCCCEDSHCLLRVDIPFFSIDVIKSICNFIEFKLISTHLCALPCQMYKIHCHCDDPTSLQCLCIKQILTYKLKNVKRKIPFLLPWTNCCSNVIFYQVVQECVIFCRYWNALHVEEEIVKNHCYRRLNFGHFKSIFVLKDVNMVTLRETLYRLHITLNLPELRGFHLPPYDNTYWKSPETADLQNQPCLVRFIRFNGMEYQERYLKRLLKNRLR
ncbi:E4.3 [Bovine adenovirus 6]|uniref:E4.3 n=1 Tax=Bovine adenovirus 6 TaxID=111167 RepID=K9MP26_9ADEN|nr:E4.3 [Bovine adenovirus 6]AFV70651.1 E4.3 [Bovine adenovirus 6]